MSAAVDQKLQRLQSGESPRLLDLFAGCGGLTLGFNLAGCEVVGGVELDPDAARSHAMNFHGADEDLLEIHSRSVDITATDPGDLLRAWGHADPTFAVDLLIGGPPCPAFTRVGRAKLREVHEHPEAFKHDPRAKLYIRYLRYVEELQPLALLMENVPDILNFGGHNLGDEISETLAELGYKARYTLLNASNYGVPQMRERFYLVALHEKVAGSFSFPEPIRRVVFPPGYHGAREVALKHVRTEELFPASSYYVDTPAADIGLPGPVTAEEALRDLPPILSHLHGQMPRGARRFNTPVEYRADAPPSAYARLMREWPGFESTGVIWDHVTRSLSDRDYRIFRQMAPGDEYPAAKAIGEKLLQAALERALSQGAPVPTGPGGFDALKAEYVPPYDAGKFPNKWRKMEPDAPARTLMAHLGKDTYSHIHYDSDQARVISVREAARLQSFPDGFVFSGTMNPAFRQIGNAVPPLMAFALAAPLLRALGVEPGGEDRFPMPQDADLYSRTA